MYHQYDNIHLIASGMGEGIGDNFLIVKVDSNKTVDFELIPLNDSEDLGNLEDYKLP